MFGAKTTVGIDIGTYDVKIVEVRRSRDRLQLAAAVRLPFPARERGSQAEREEHIEHVLRTFFGEGPLRGVTLVTCVPMGWSTVRTIDLPPAEAEEVARIVRFEAESHIPLPLEDVELDHALIRTNGSTEAVIAACRKNLIAAQLLPLERLNLRPHVVDVSSLAAIRSLTAAGEPAEPLAILDLGATATEISILDARGWPRVSRSLPLGGDALTEALAQDLQVEFEAAELQKKQTGLLGPAGKTYQEGLAALPTVEQWVVQWTEELRRSFQVFRALPTGGPVERIRLVGGGAGTVGLAALLRDRLGVTVQTGRPWAPLEVAPEVQEPEHLFAVATGLALHGLGGTPAVNLLPQVHRQSRRSYRQQTSLQWVSVLLLSVGVVGSLLMRWSLAHKEAQRKGLESAIAQMENRLGGKVGRVKNLDERLELLRNLRREVEERSNWLEILRQVSSQKPESVSLSDLSFDKNRAAVFKGEAVSSAAVADALEMLRGIRPFEDARIDYINETKVNDQPIYEFQITCTLPQREGGRVARAQPANRGEEELHVP